MEQKNEVLYMAVTADKFEFPMFVCDTIQELANWAGKPCKTICDFIQWHTRDEELGCFYLKINFEKSCNLNIKITIFL